jgi:hypothetical protein
MGYNVRCPGLGVFAASSVRWRNPGKPEAPQRDQAVPSISKIPGWYQVPAFPLSVPTAFFAPPSNSPNRHPVHLHTHRRSSIFGDRSPLSHRMIVTRAIPVSAYIRLIVHPAAVRFFRMFLPTRRRTASDHSSGIWFM